MVSPPGKVISQSTPSSTSLNFTGSVIGQEFGRDFDRFLAAHKPARLQRVNAHVHQRPAARQIFLYAPFRRGDAAAESGLDGLQFTEHFFLREAAAFDMARVVLAAITDAQHFAGLLGFGNHLLATFGGNFHRLFAKDVLACLERLDGMFRVQAVWRDDIDDINVRIVCQLVHLVVAVNILVGNVVFRLPDWNLRGRAGDNSDQAAILRQLQRRRELAVAQAAQAGERETQLARRAIGGAQAGGEKIYEWK